MAEWLKAADCKSAHVSVRRFEPYSAHFFSNTDVEKCANNINELHIFFHNSSGSSSIGRAIAFQAIGREFEPRLPL